MELAKLILQEPFQYTESELIDELVFQKEITTEMLFGKTLQVANWKTEEWADVISKMTLKPLAVIKKLKPKDLNSAVERVMSFF